MANEKIVLNFIFFLVLGLLVVGTIFNGMFQLSDVYLTRLKGALLLLVFCAFSAA